MILHSYDFTTMAEDCLGKIYFKVGIRYKGVQSLKKNTNNSWIMLQVKYSPESETLTVNLHKFKYCPDQLTKNGVIVK